MKYILAVIAVIIVAGLIWVTRPKTPSCVTAPTTAQVKAGEATNLGYGGVTPSKTQLTLCK